jgi:hypothetical protein
MIIITAESLVVSGQEEDQIKMFLEHLWIYIIDLDDTFQRMLKLYVLGNKFKA